LKAVPHDTLYDRLDREWFIYQNGEVLCSLYFWAIPGKTGTECVKIASDACSPVDYYEEQGIYGFKIFCLVNHYVYWEKHDTEICSELKIMSVRDRTARSCGIKNKYGTTDSSSCAPQCLLELLCQQTAVNFCFVYLNWSPSIPVTGTFDQASVRKRTT
jgi:hypothetical protein